jgi:hypothetical protein
MAPLWRADSRELYFYQVDPSGTTFYGATLGRAGGDNIGAPEALWSHAQLVFTGMPYGSGYDVTPDGRRFLVTIN